MNLNEKKTERRLVFVFFFFILVLLEEECDFQWQTAMFSFAAFFMEKFVV